VSFWNWAVKAYGGEGVAEACLSLQDEDGQNVPLLLWAAWLASEGFGLTDSLAAEAAVLTRNWSDELIVPLRLLRRRLKTELSTGDEALRLPLREKIKAIELEAERALMTKLAGLEVAVKYDVNHGVKVLALANLHAVSQAWGGVVPETGLSRLIEALSDGRFLQYNL
jgi:uncharacterized protein (TIGR02444 family)